MSEVCSWKCTRNSYLLISYISWNYYEKGRETVIDITKAVVVQQRLLNKEPEDHFNIIETKDVGRNSGWWI